MVCQWFVDEALTLVRTSSRSSSKFISFISSMAESEALQQRTDRTSKTAVFVGSGNIRDVFQDVSFFSKFFDA